MIKFLIVGEKNIDKTKLTDLILEKTSNLSVSLLFTTNIEKSIDKYYYYISNEELNICYKNNAFLYIKTDLDNSYGVIIDDFNNHDIIFMNTEDFNNISNKIFTNNYDFLIIWLDTKNHDKNTIKNEIKETNYLIEKINTDNLKYLYFLDQPFEEISNIIIEYANNPDKREEILENFS